ncbi:glycosyltransferase family 2 protein [Enterococcus cecorum]|uniref:glycosyltransferase family 2 protein n=1 Tax=Enterococcus cecorum TaxID=44008 RepID=UPI0032C3FB9F
MISFIIPVYNSENTIQRCIDSILSQTCNEYEIITVNDCSQDGSKLRLEKYGEKIVVLENSKNKGVSATRNRALKEAQGDWITFVDSDDYVVPYFVESIEMAGRSDSDLLIWKTQHVIQEVQIRLSIKQEIWQQAIIHTIHLDWVYR